MVLFNYNSIQKIAVFFPILALLALTIGGVQKVGRDLDTFKKTAFILEEPLFLYCLQTLCQSEHYRYGTFLSIYLPSSFIHR